jgi:hypothetical protein
MLVWKRKRISKSRSYSFLNEESNNRNPTFYNRNHIVMRKNILINVISVHKVISMFDSQSYWPKFCVDNSSQTIQPTQTIITCFNCFIQTNLLMILSSNHQLRLYEH